MKKRLAMFASLKRNTKQLDSVTVNYMKINFSGTR